MNKVNSGKNLLITTVVGLVSFLFLLRVSTKNYNKLIETRKINVDQAGEFISENFREEVVQHIQTLQNLKGRLEETNGAYFENWEYDAELMREQSESIMFVEWIDSNMVIQRINPYEGNQNALGLYIGDIEYRAFDWIQAAKDSVINFTEWAQLVQGSQAFLVDAPVYYNDEFQGSITAGMNFNKLFDEILSERQEYYITLSDHKNVTFYTSKDSSDINEFEKYIYRKTFSVVDKEEPWTFTLQPNSRIIARSAFQRIGAGLALGVTLSILLTIAVYFILELKSAEKRLKVLNEDLNLQKVKAEESSNAKTEFLSNMSHEIRTPLSGVMGLIEIMKTEKQENIKGYLEMLETSSNNLLSLVNDVLDLNKIESGNFVLVETEFILNEELQKIYDLNKQVFEEKGLYLTLDQSELKKIKIRSDLGKLTQVFGNLIRNAYKFTEKGGLAIHCSSKRVNKHLKANISFSDSGIGVSEDKQEYIFERFTQIDSGLNRKFEGTGLGLSITRQILEFMGGSISLKSNEGKGATFEIEIFLPIVEEIEIENQVTKIEEQSVTDFSSFNVLIVDDSALNLLVLEKILRRYNVNIDKAENGEIAVQKAISNTYDIIFMDLHMPRMDGFEAAREIKRKGVKTPIITISANVTQDAMAKAKETGMLDFITKPYTNERIYSVLNAHLSQVS